MLNKKKECAGWDGKSHPAFIYKNINGKKYCKQCAYRLQPPKQIPKQSEKQRQKVKENVKLTAKQTEFFNQIWEERKREDGRNYCEVSGERLPSEPLSIYFDHLVEKSTHPEYRFDPENIIIVSWDVHANKTNGFPHPEHLRRINEFKEKRGIK